tara:strand:+ start:2166 stop:5606 length:3441 start_codon:yes stop_codon:yes gene_type:complete
MLEDYTTFSKEKLTRENLVKNFNFISDARAFLADREDYYSDDPNEVYDRYLEHFRYQNVNEVTAVRDMYQAQDYQRKGDIKSLNRMGKLMDTFDKQDSEFTSETLTDYLGGIFTAPSTYAGMFSFGAGKGGALAAQQGIKFGIKEIIKNGAKVEGKNLTTGALKKAGNYSRLKALREGFANGGYKAAIGAGVVDALGAAGTVAAQEETRVTYDPTREFDNSNVAFAGAIGFLPGSLIGGFTGSQKAITSNAAEAYLQNAMKENRKLIQSSYKNHTYKNLNDTGSVGKLTRDLNSKLKKVALSESAEESLKLGKKLKIDLAPERGTLLSFDSKLIANISSAGAELLNKIGPAPNVTKGSREDLEERITAKIARGFNSPNEADRNAMVESFQGILKKHNLTAQEFGALYLAEISEAGRTLGVQGRIAKKDVKELFGNLTEIDKGLYTLGRTTEIAREGIRKNADRGNFLNSIDDFFTSLNKTRIGLMTIQLATTVRNTTNGYLRNYVYGLNNLNAGVLRQVKAGALLTAGFLRKPTFNLSDDSLKRAGTFASKEGVADLKNGLSSAYLKDMVLGMQSEDTAVLVRMFRDPRLGNSEKAVELFRSLGDIGNATSSRIGTQNSRMMRTASFLNGFNTFSDNMFKAAIFSRELNKLISLDAGDVFKKNGINNLSDLVSQGKLKMMDDKAIASAMQQAMDFTYQTGRFKGREGGFNKFADGFIDIFSSKLGSAFVPFPRYMINAFRFAYEHAPIIGLYDAAGILNKAGGIDRLSKQITGLTTLTAFYGMREQLGDETTGAYQYKNPFGHGTFDARAALGPFTPFAALADYLYRLGKPKGYFEREYGFRLHDNDKVSENMSIRELSTALTGGSFGRAGVSLDMVDGLAKVLAQEGNLSDQTKFSEASARFAGNYLSTFIVGAGMIKDVYAMTNPEYRLLTDNTDVGFVPYMLKQATRSFPMEAHADGDGFFERPIQTSPYKSSGIMNHMPLFRQISGLTPQEPRNTAQKELDRLRLDYVEVAPRKLGDPEANRDARLFTGYALEGYLADYINSPEYHALKNDYQKKKALKIEMANIKNEALAYALKEQDWDTSEDIERKNKARYLKLRSLDRKIIEREWKDRNPNDELGQDDYGELLDIGLDLKLIKSKDFLK